MSLPPTSGLPRSLSGTRRRSHAPPPPPPSPLSSRQIADAAPPRYAAADPAAFRSWLASRAAALDGPALLAEIAALSDGTAVRCALVPLVFLAHAHRWGATRPPQWVLDEGDAAPGLPPPLDAALTALRSPLGLQASGSISILFLWNWRLVGGGGAPPPGAPFDPATHLSTAALRPRFRFCDPAATASLAAAEDAVLCSVLLTEAAGTGMGRALVRLFESAAAAEGAAREDWGVLKRAAVAGPGGRALAAVGRAALPWSPAHRARRSAADAAAAAADLASSLKRGLATFHAVFRQAAIPVEAWAHHIQPSLCAVARGDHGVGGAQMPWVHASDAAFGIDQAGDALGAVVAANEGCLLPEERLFVAFCRAHGVPLRRWLGGRPASSGAAASLGPGLAPLGDLAAPARASFTAALTSLVAWRATHRARAAAYLAPPGAPARATTGGTARYGGGSEEAGGGGGAGGGGAARAAFNALMDGRIASTRRAGDRLAAPGPGPPPSSASPAMAELFPE